MNRPLIVIILIVYCTSVFFMLGSMNKDINFGDCKDIKSETCIDYSISDNTISPHVKFLGMEIDVTPTFLGNIIVNISILPVWFNFLFIVLPSAILIIYGILMFIPTIPSG